MKVILIALSTLALSLAAEPVPRVDAIWRVPGEQHREAAAIVADHNGNIFVAGNVVLPNPTPPPGFFNPTDVFVTKLDPNGDHIFTTVLKGSGRDQAAAIAVDPSGDVYITGFTNSDDFPMVSAFQETVDTQYGSAFVARLDGADGHIVYSTALGKAAIAQGLAVDNLGSAYVTGFTWSNDYPTTPGALRTETQGDQFTGARLTFVTRLHPTGKELIASAVVGGIERNCHGGSACLSVHAQTMGYAVTFDAEGNIYVAGSTNTPDFPVTPTAIQKECRCLDHAGDAFVLVLNSEVSSVLYGTFLGGTPFGPSAGFGDAAYAIALDRAGDIFIAGYAESGDFPVTQGAAQTHQTGPFPVGDAFIAKLSRGGTSLVYSTFLGGGRSREEVRSMAIDATGRAVVSGRVNDAVVFSSTDSPVGSIVIDFPGFPLTGGSFERGSGFLTIVAADGSKFEYSGRFPNGVAGRLALRPDGTIYLIGDSSSRPVGITRVPYPSTPETPPSTPRFDPVITRLRPAVSRLPAIYGIANAAGDSVSSEIAPGEILSIYGLDLGPDEPNNLAIGPDGRVTMELDGTSVYFLGISAPILWAQRDQINVVVPYEIAGYKSVNVIVKRRDGLSQIVDLNVAPAAPEIFSYDGQRAAALNQDGSLNGMEESQRARMGEIVTIFATGEGLVTPIPERGEISAEPLPKPVLPVAVEVSGVDAEVVYAGAAPTLVSGVMQVNFRVPVLQYPFDVVSVVLRVGDRVSRSALIWIRN